MKRRCGESLRQHIRHKPLIRLIRRHNVVLQLRLESLGRVEPLNVADSRQKIDFQRLTVQRFLPAQHVYLDFGSVVAECRIRPLR